MIAQTVHHDFVNTLTDASRADLDQSLFEPLSVPLTSVKELIRSEMMARRALGVILALRGRNA